MNTPRTYYVFVMSNPLDPTVVRAWHVDADELRYVGEAQWIEFRRDERVVASFSAEAVTHFYDFEEYEKHTSPRGGEAPKVDKVDPTPYR